MEEVAGRLVKITHDNGFKAVKISGNEPTLCREHLRGQAKRKIIVQKLLLSKYVAFLF